MMCVGIQVCLGIQACNVCIYSGCDYHRDPTLETSKVCTNSVHCTCHYPQLTAVADAIIVVVVVVC